MDEDDKKDRIERLKDLAETSELLRGRSALLQILILGTTRTDPDLREQSVLCLEDFAEGYLFLCKEDQIDFLNTLIAMIKDKISSVRKAALKVLKQIKLEDEDDYLAYQIACRLINEETEEGESNE